MFSVYWLGFSGGFDCKVLKSLPDADADLERGLGGSRYQDM